VPAKVRAKGTGRGKDAAAEKASDVANREGIKARRANRGHLPTQLPREET
jgi:hypothetical protein